MVTSNENKSPSRNQWIIYNENIKTGNCYDNPSINGSNDNHFMTM